MKDKIIGVFTFHFIPIVCAFFLTVCTLFLFESFEVKAIKNKQLIVGKQLMLRGRNSNFEAGIQSELALAGSLSNPKSITIFGSSELSESTYVPYYFLPDSLHTPTVAFGHAYHQSFSVFCELLAMQKKIKKAKICIMISPGWFDTDGTNIAAFLEFVRPNFLKSIINNDIIPMEFKMEIGKYISSKLNDIEQPSQSILTLNKLYQNKKYLFLNDLVNELSASATVNDVIYSVKLPENTLPKASVINWAVTKKRVQDNFVSAIKANSIFVNDEYYITYLLDSNKVYKHGEASRFSVPENREFSDVKLLIQLLRMYQCEASFVIQPLNPYHYNHLENFNAIIDSITSVIEQNNFPCLNMFVTKKQDYEPGTLKDVMHLGDYGWMRVNEFLVNTYKLNKP